MLETSTIEGTNVVAATYRGSLGADEMDAFREQLANASERGPVRLLLQYEDMDVGRIEPEAVWKDLKTAGMLDEVDRCAVVTDEGLMGAVASVADRVAPFEVRQYGLDERDEAVAWLAG